MKARFLGLTIVGLALFAPALQAEDEPKPAAPGVQWVTRLDAALARAKDAAKPVLVFCYAPHAPAARHLKKTIWTDPRVATALDRHFVPLLLNADALDSAQSGDAAMSRFGVRMLPTHLVLDAEGLALITERGLPASDPTGMIKWLEARAGDVATHRKQVEAVKAQSKAAGPKLELLQSRLELATRLGSVTGSIKVFQPPASAKNRQIDAVVSEAAAVAREFDEQELKLAYRAWSIWASASLNAGVNKAAALSRVDSILDQLAREAKPEGAIVAFNTAYALFESSPAAARPYLRRVIKSWPDSDVYWQARVYEAYSHGRTGDETKARTLFEAIVKEGPADDKWVKSAKKTLRQLAKRKGG